MTDTHYKVLGPSGKPCHGGKGAWKLPRGKRPGAWMPRIENPVLCQRGYHLCRRGDLVHWLGPTIYEVELAPDDLVVSGDDKVVTSGPVRLVRRMTRWSERAARLFAADCAEHVLPIFERAHPRDDRPRKAIAAARAFARGETSAAARAAASAAASDAAWAAARDAAWAAAWAAVSAAARDAAWDAAWAAARDAARAAARDAARDAERAWQTDRLWAYLDGEVIDE